MQIRCSPQTRIAVAMFAALAAAPLLSACETLFEAQAVREHPAPGKLVDVGDGRRIQIDCRGAGSPTIVFQSGGDLMGSLAWTAGDGEGRGKIPRLRLQPRRHSLERSGARDSSIRTKSRTTCTPR